MVIPRISALALLAMSIAAQDLELTALANHLRGQISKSGKKVVAIWEITNSQGYSDDFAQYIEDELSIKLLQDAPGFRMVTRSQLDKVMKEQGLRHSEEFNPATFTKLGKFTGADAIVTGTFQVLTSSVRVSLKVLDVSDGAMVTGVSGTLPKTKDLEAYLRRTSPVEIGSAPASTSRPPTGIAVAAEQVVQAGALTFRLQQCTVDATRAACRLKITSPQQDRHVSVGSSCCNWPPSRLFDQDGNEFHHAQITIGSKTNARAVDLLLVRDIPVNAEIIFPLNRDVQSIALLKLLTVQDKTVYTAEFRNIRPVSARVTRPATKKN